MKNALSVFLLVLVVFFATFLYLRGQNATASVVLGGESFKIEVADTESLRERGLSGHKPLLDNEGMFFVFEKEGNYSFWMKDMLFSIDILWIDKSFKIKHIEASVGPESYPKVFYPNSEVLYVLEVPAGTVERLNIKTEDSVKFVKK